MKKIESGDPSVLELRTTTHGCLVLLGLPFFAVGLFGLLSAAGVIPVETPEGFWEHMAMYPFAAVFALVGLVMMLGRRGLVLDLRRRLVVKWFGLAVPMKRTELRLDEYRRVTLTRQVSSGKSNTVFYPVRLGGPAVKDIEVASNQDYHLSRRLAEMIAKHLGLPLADSSSGEEVVREAAYLDESLRDQILRSGERIELPSTPPALRSRIDTGVDAVTIDIPAEGFGLADIAQIGITLVVIGAFSVVFGGIMFGTEIPRDIRYLLLGLFVVFFVAAPLYTVAYRYRSRIGGTRVTLSPTALELAQGGKRTTMPVNELEELSLTGCVGLGSMLTELPDGRVQIDASRVRGGGGPQQPQVLGPQAAGLLRTLARFKGGPSIQARSDKLTITFGRGLESEELVYLVALIKKVITTGP